MSRTRLSPRETECLRWISLGKTSWETAAILGVSEHTVNFHVRNACSKLRVPNRQAAVAAALQAGIIKPVIGRVSATTRTPGRAPGAAHPGGPPPRFR